RCSDAITGCRRNGVPQASEPRPLAPSSPPSWASSSSTRCSRFAPTPWACDAMQPGGQHRGIAIEDLSVGYGTQPVQTGINVEIGQGEIFAIVGDSGSGKSTLMKTMVGLLPSQGGRVLFDGRTLAQCMQAGAPPFGILFQSGALWSSMSVLENVM